jgi:hypothetical protein
MPEVADPGSGSRQGFGSASMAQPVGKFLARRASWRAMVGDGTRHDRERFRSIAGGGAALKPGLTGEDLTGVGRARKAGALKSLVGAAISAGARAELGQRWRGPGRQSSDSQGSREAEKLPFHPLLSFRDPETRASTFSGTSKIAIGTACRLTGLPPGSSRQACLSWKIVVQQRVGLRAITVRSSR